MRYDAPVTINASESLAHRSPRRSSTPSVFASVLGVLCDPVGHLALWFVP